MRPWTENDIDALHQLWIEPEVRRYLWDDVVISRERAVESTRGIGYWALHTADAEVGFSASRLAQPQAYVLAGAARRLEESLKTITPAASVNRPNPTYIHPDVAKM